MLEIDTVAEEFLRHVVTRPSGLVACSVGAAFESWFQVELAHMLHMKGLGTVRFGYDYPNSRCKADLACECERGISVFEIKCFVHGADANKMQKWPEQLARLVDLVKDRYAEQGIAVSTYYGYSEQRTMDLATRFHQKPWRSFGPRKFLENAPLRVVAGSVTTADVSPQNEIQ
jgi:hypothetical protein